MDDHRLEIVLAAKDTTSKAFSSVYSRVTGLSKKFMSLQAAAIGVSAGGLAYVVKSSLELTSEIDRNAKMAGVGVKAFQELSYAAKQYQITEDALTDGLKELSLRTDEFVNTGAGSAAESFLRLGYSQESLNEKLADTPALFSEIIEKLQSYDKAAQIRIADELFGGQGGEQFVRMVRGGSDALKQMIDEANHLGVVMDESMIKNADNARREIDRLSMVLSYNFQAVVADLAPDIGEIVKNTGDWIISNREFITQDMPNHVKDAAKYVAELSGKIGDVVATYNSLPTEITGPASYGIVGTMLFGAKAGLTIAAIKLGYELLKDLSEAEISNKIFGDPAAIPRAVPTDTKPKLFPEDQVVLWAGQYQAVEKAANGAGMSVDEFVSKTVNATGAVGNLSDTFGVLVPKLQSVKKSGNVITPEMITMADQLNSKYVSLEDQLTAIKGLYDTGLITEDIYVKAVGEVGAQYVDVAEKTSDEVERIWENTRDTIQNSIASLGSSFSKGNFTGWRDFFSGLGSSMGDVFWADFSQTMMQQFTSSDFTSTLGDAFNTMFGTAFKDSDVAAGMLGTISAGISAAAAGNVYQMGGVGLGAFAGFALGGGPLGMAAGASIGGGIGSLFNGDDEWKTYINNLIRKMDEQIRATEYNTNAQLARLNEQYPYGAELDIAGQTTSSNIIDLLSSTTGGDSSYNAGFGIAPLAMQFGYEGPITNDDWETIAENFGLKEIYDAIPGAIELATEKFGNSKAHVKALEYIQTEIENYFANIETISSDAIDSIGTSISGWVDKLDINIPGFSTTEFEKINQSFDEALGESGFMGTIKRLKEMSAAGLVDIADEDIDKLDRFGAGITAIGNAIPKYFENLQGQTLLAMQTSLAGLETPMTTVDSAIKKIVEDAKDYRSELVDNGMAMKDAIAKTNEWTAAMARATRQQLVASTASELRLRKIQAIGDEEAMLDYQHQMELKDLANTYGEGTAAYEAFSKQLKEIWKLEDNSALESGKNAALDSLTSFYSGIKDKVDDLIWDLQGGVYASVQSEEGMASRYAELYADAFKTGDIDKFTSFVSGDFIDFVKAYGNYDDVSQKIVEDLQTLQTNWVNDATLADVTSLIENSNMSLAEIVSQTTQLNSTMSKLTGYASGGYHAGGLRVVGEEGPELEYTGPATIFKNDAMSSILAGAGGSNVTVQVFLDRGRMEDLVARTVQTHSETQRQVRRVSRS